MDQWEVEASCSLSTREVIVAKTPWLHTCIENHKVVKKLYLVIAAAH